MAAIKVKNKNGEWETVGVATANGIEDINQYDKGFDDGRQKGYNQGYSNGYSDGNAVGLDTGRMEGRQAESEIRDAQNAQYLSYINDRISFWGVAKAETLSDVPQAIDSVHARGMTVGEEDIYNAGHADGLTEGAQAEYDRFWDVFQNYGNAKRYSYAFAYNRFDGNYNPKYPINCENSYAGGSYLFNGSNLITDTVVDISIPNSASSAFYNCNSLVRIPKLIITKNTTFSDTFKLCSALEDITIEGEINNNISFSDSTKLSKQSIANIIGCLLGSSSGKTFTLSKSGLLLFILLILPLTAKIFLNLEREISFFKLLIESA